MAMNERIELATTLPDIQPVSYPYALASLGRAAYTLFRTPEHAKLHQVLEEGCLHNGLHQPVHVPIDETVRQMHEEVLPGIDLSRPITMGTRRQL